MQIDNKGMVYKSESLQCSGTTFGALEPVATLGSRVQKNQQRQFEVKVKVEVN